MSNLFIVILIAKIDLYDSCTRISERIVHPLIRNSPLMPHLVIPRVTIRYRNPWPHKDTFFRLSMSEDENSNK